LLTQIRSGEGQAKENHLHQAKTAVHKMLHQPKTAHAEVTLKKPAKTATSKKMPKNGHLPANGHHEILPAKAEATNGGFHYEMSNAGDERDKDFVKLSPA